MDPQTTEFFSCGTRCAAVLWLPDGAGPDAPCPGVVMCHGFTGIKEWLLPPFAEAFRDAGFAVLTFDYRGFGESDGARGRLVPQEQVEDIRNAFTFLATHEAVDGERVGLWGTSFGGGNVIQTAGIDPRPKCVVAQVCFGSIPRIFAAGPPEQLEGLQTMLAQDAATRVRTGQSMHVDPMTILNDEQSARAFAAGVEAFPNLRVEIPLEALAGIAEYEPERVVARIAPRGLLLIGAEHDTATPISETHALYAAAGEPKRMEILDIEHYAIYDLPDRTEAIRLALEWFDTYLGPAGG